MALSVRPDRAEPVTGSGIPTATRPVILVRAWPDTPAPDDLAVLCAGEHARLRLFERARDAAGFAAGRALLRTAAGQRLGCAPEAVPLHAPAGRRPVIRSSTLPCSVAHGGDLVVVALGTGGRIGVDVEPLDQAIGRDELAGIARDVLGAPAAEVAAIRAATPDGAGPTAAFLERWTLVEAVLKALGTGLAADPRLVRLVLAGPAGTPRLLAAPGIDGAAAARWTLSTIASVPGHVIALAVDGPAAEPVIDRAA